MAREVAGHFQLHCQEPEDLSGGVWQPGLQPQAQLGGFKRREVSGAAPPVRLTPATAVQSRAQPSSSSCMGSKQSPGHFQSLALLFTHLQFQVKPLQACHEGCFSHRALLAPDPPPGSFPGSHANLRDFHVAQNKEETEERLVKIKQARKKKKKSVAAPSDRHCLLPSSWF